MDNLISVWLLILVTLLSISAEKINTKNDFKSSDEVVDIDQCSKNVTTFLVEKWKQFDREQMRSEVLNKMATLLREIDSIQHKIHIRTTWDIGTLNLMLHKNTDIKNILSTLSYRIGLISDQQKIMLQYVEHKEKLEEATLEKFATWTVSPQSEAIQGHLKLIHFFLVGGTAYSEYTHNTGILQLIREILNEKIDHTCTTKQSTQQILYHIYEITEIIRLKGYIMMQFAWLILRSYNKGNFTRELDLMWETYRNESNKIKEVLQKEMKEADTSVWQCDHEDQLLNRTYHTITRLLQGYVENEVDMTENMCRGKCSDHQFTYHRTCQFEGEYCNRQTPCTGKILHCRFIDSDMFICPSKNTNRRYEYIEYTNGKIFGKRTHCKQGITKVDSWWRWIFWHCSYCLCLCDAEGSKSDRYFSLRPALSNTTANRVVTGLRFVKLYQIVHLQVQEGYLLSNGNINSKSLRWVPVSQFKKIDRGILDGFDYHKLAWNKRGIDLDDLMAPKHHVVTGVRFRTLGARLNFEIRVTSMDYVSGKLIDIENSYWYSNDNTKRKEVVLDRPDGTIGTNSMPTSKHNQYIEFTNTDFEKDLAQLTVPYLDAQDVIPLPAVPLSGAGIYHKGYAGNGGFIAPKLFTYDLTQMLNNNEN